MKIRLDEIKPSPRPVRTSWDEDKLNELAQSIKEQGLIVPVKVRPLFEVCPVHGVEYFDGWENAEQLINCPLCSEMLDSCEDEEGDASPTYELIYGHRRIEAARRAGLEEVEAIVEGVDDTAALIQALIENVQREDMSPLDKARALKAIQDETGWSQDKIAQQGIITPRSHVSELMALVHDIPEMQEAVNRRHVDVKAAAHMRAALPDAPEMQRAIIDKTITEGLGREQVRQVTRAIASEPDPEVREELLERPYRDNPHLWEARAKEYVADKRKRREQKPSSLEWQLQPEVKNELAFLKDIVNERLPNWDRMMEMGKFAPEAIPFFIRKVRELAAALNDWADSMEKKYNGNV